MANLRFTREHEWIRIDGDVGTIGISDYAQQQLGDVVFVELPAVGREVQAGGEAAVVESVKAASEVYSPASGEVIEVNEGLQDEPAKVNADAGGGGWFFKIRIANPSELEALMDQAAYKDYVAGLS
ncbi:MAG: glycine cleavage system protein GcvH [Rhodospirillales bacterium]|jgi:glycine cleavage system H protein|nr:glycine cleavage system protein GcvH [Rhodospirillales bacterium]